MESKASRRGAEAITPGATGADAGRPTPYAAYAPGDKVRVKPEFDIPPMFRQGPSRGVVDHILNDTLIVIVDGKSVPYQPEEVERDD